MKNLIMILVAALFFGTAAYADDKPIKFDKLPSPAKEFVKKHFPGETVLAVTQDDDFIRPDYSVILSGGAKIEFENSGALEKVKVTGGSVPEKILPVQVSDFVKKNYPQTHVVEYEIGRTDYEVQLSNGLELKFNPAFKLVDIDD